MWLLHVSFEMIRFLQRLSIWAALGFLAMPSISSGKDMVSYQLGQARLQISAQGTRISILDGTAKPLVPGHAEAGVLIDGIPMNVRGEGDGDTLRLASATGMEATLKIVGRDGLAAITITPDGQASKDKPHRISLQFGGMPVAYGLGDVGGWNKTLNLVNDSETTYRLDHNAGKLRWLSSFVIFPRNQFAFVALDGLARSAVIGPERVQLSVETQDAATFYCLTGDMEQIYADYQKVLREAGRPIIKPKFRLFELGWESWAALGWKTNAETVLESIARFQAEGFPIRWAVTGSGFWEEGGTTTSFGKFGEKFPEPKKFKEALNRMDVKWMIGLRTNFVPPGGPFKPVTEKRDHNLEVKTFLGNPLSQEGLDKGYFLKKADGSLWKNASGCFPLVPCYLIDGTNKDAAEWFATLYQQWEVDGIKEDTMMHLGRHHLETFNWPIARIAEDGALVIARCGSDTSPGTLLRINDTGVQETSQRIPINYLQDAASAAPNAYSDTVGFRRMKTYSDIVVRQAWLMALTAGMAIGESASGWSKEEQALFKKPFDFHYRIAPTLYDAAMKSYLTGYPFTMTPLGIAYADNPEAAETPHFQWMIGDSLLCAPLLKDPSGKHLDIYLPEGIWFDHDTGEKFTGPTLLKEFPMPVGKTPCFIGGKGIFVTRASDESPLRVHSYPIGKSRTNHVIHHPDGTSTSEIAWAENGTHSTARDLTSGKALAVSQDAKTGALSFEILPGHQYLID